MVAALAGAAELANPASAGGAATLDLLVELSLKGTVVGATGHRVGSFGFGRRDRRAV